MATLTNTQINQTYIGLLKFDDNGTVQPTALKALSDGTGGSLPISLSQVETKFTPGTIVDFHWSNSKRTFSWRFSSRYWNRCYAICRFLNNNCSKCKWSVCNCFGRRMPVQKQHKRLQLVETQNV